MLKVVFISPFPMKPGEPTGGVEAAMENLYAGMAELQEVEALVVDIRPEFKSAVREDLAMGPLVRLPAGPALRRAYTSRRRLSDLIGNWKPDIVHLQAAAQLAPRDRPWILTVHGFIERESHYEPGSPVRRFLKSRTLVREQIRARDSAESVIAISHYTQLHLPANPRRRVWQIPNAIHPSTYRVRRAASRRGVVFAGRLTPLKGVRHLLRAFRAVVDALPDTTLTLAGPTDGSQYAAECVELSRALGLTTAVRFVGPLSRSELQTAIAASRCLVLPSFVEVAPMVVAESLALGTPVVASAVGAIPEMVSQHVGRLVPSGDVSFLSQAIIEVLSDSGSQMHASARAMGRNYEPQTVARMTLEAYVESLRL